MPKEPKRRPPQASRTIEGLRDTGYESTTALADIVDNSIAAKATRIYIDFIFNPLGEIVLFVSDNGEGMSEDKLDDAMTYGSSIRTDPASLGKFGLGLKTASTAMARSLTVLTRNGPGAGPFSAKWDLDYVAAQNDWLLQYPEGNEIQEEIQRLEHATEGESGTVVSWRKVDRLMTREYKTEQGRLNDFTRQEKALKESLQLTYHKFLDTNNNVENISIYFNGENLEPWDPFGKGISQVLYDDIVPVDGIDESDKSAGLKKIGDINVTSYVFPPVTELKEDQRKEAVIGAGTSRTTGTPTTHQGIYVYRHNRLICYGNWLGIRSVEPHQNLHRVDFSFDHHLDDFFSLDIKKSQIRINTDIVDYVGQVLAPSINEADSRSRRNERKKAKLEGGKKHTTSNNIVDKHAKGLSQDITLDQDSEKDKVTVTNNHGKIKIVMGSTEAPEEPHVVTSEDMNDPFVLWEPFFNISTMKQAVRMHVGHEFYRRVYGNLDPGLGIEAMDAFLWALMQAELKTVNGNNPQFMKGIRHEVSRILHEISLHNFNEPDVE